MYLTPLCVVSLYVPYAFMYVRVCVPGESMCGVLICTFVFLCVVLVCPKKACMVSLYVPYVFLCVVLECPRRKHVRCPYMYLTSFCVSSLNVPGESMCGARRRAVGQGAVACGVQTLADPSVRHRAAPLHHLRRAQPGALEGAQRHGVAAEDCDRHAQGAASRFLMFHSKPTQSAKTVFAVFLPLFSRSFFRAPPPFFPASSLLSRKRGVLWTECLS
jgi:hypothetical protein